MSEPLSVERYQGCLVGQCLGDAIGWPVEGSPKQACAEHLAVCKAWCDAREEPDEEFGQYTDDSQLARELLITYQQRRRFDPVSYADKIRFLFEENVVVGRGIASDEAARRLTSGQSWETSGCPPPRAGNGTAMRAAPVGLMHPRDNKALTKAARDQSWITHHDDRCTAGSIAIAKATAMAAQAESIDAVAFVNDIAALMEPHHEHFASLMQKIPTWLELPPERAVAHVNMASYSGEEDHFWPGISPYVVPSVLWSVYAFLRAPASYWDAIAVAIGVGGDVDTIGAMTGAISGAYLGIDALPPVLSHLVHDHGHWGYDELCSLSADCHELATSS